MASDKIVSEDDAIRNFREYLQIPSVQPDVDYSDCIKFLEKQAKALKLPYKVVNLSPRKPVFIITWAGSKPDLPSILLNSHMDVVPVHEELWTHKPFAAEIEDGKIYARGAQDMKCVGIQYLEAIRALKGKGKSFARTIHVSFVPDEEIGSVEGMKKFVKTEEFKHLNVGFALDEAVVGDKNKYPVFYAEKVSWDILVHCTGKADHGAVVERDHAGEKLAKILSKIYAFRDSESKKHEANPEVVTESDVISINVTQINGGVQINVIPSEFTFTIDCRIPPAADAAGFEQLLQTWCKEAGEGVWFEYLRKEPVIEATRVDDTNVFWKAFKTATDEMGMELKVMVCPGGTDARFVRQAGIPAIGFTPGANHKILLHGNDEYLRVDTFLKGIEIYCNILTKICNA